MRRMRDMCAGARREEVVQFSGAVGRSCRGVLKKGVEREPLVT